MDGGKEYTQRVINVTFKYSLKEYNKVYDGLYVKNGFSIDDAALNDCVCIKGGSLIAIQVNQPVKQPLSKGQLGKYFYFDGGQYRAKQNIGNVLGVADLRERLYQDGFYCDGIKYVRFKRSSGSSRIGKCLFIDEKLYGRMHRWEMCGIKIKEGQAVDLAALEAYIALPLSSIIGTIRIRPENFLLIDDYESTFEDKVVAVDVVDDKLHAGIKKASIQNSCWDGQSLIDPSLMGGYAQYGFILLRNRFFKSACFNCNIQQWFSDHGVTQVSQLKGYTMAKRVADIKVITTPSSIKFLKFGKIEDWLKQLDTDFGVVKHEKPTHFFGGRLVQTHYQLLNSLHMTQQKVDAFLHPSIHYVDLLKTDPAVFRYHIKYAEGQEAACFPMASRNDVLYKMLGINEAFTKTKLYADFRDDSIKSYIRGLRKGHVLVNGNYATMLGNPVEMLQASIGTFQGESQLGVGNIHALRFPFGIKLLGSRSPHVTAGNILLASNSENVEVDRYFNLTNEIVCVNSIGENLLNRLSGCDFDSDTVLLTDNHYLIEAAEKHYDEFLVPTGLVPGKKLKRKYTAKEKADLDIKTSVNKIGEIINLSQELNTLLWHRVNSGERIADLADLYCDIAKLDVLSNLEIDKAKKEYVVDSVAEIKLIKEKYHMVHKDGRKVKPNFFGHIAKAKGYYDPQKKFYKFYDTTMDYLQHTLNCRGRKKLVEKQTPFSSILKPTNLDYSKVNYQQIKRIVDIVRDTSEQVRHIYSIDDAPKIKCELADGVRQACIDYIGQACLNRHTMYRLLTTIESEAYKDVRRLLFRVLFAAPNKSFFQLIADSSTPVRCIAERIGGEIDIYGFSFVHQLF